MLYVLNQLRELPVTRFDEILGTVSKE